MAICFFPPVDQVEKNKAWCLLFCAKIVNKYLVQNFLINILSFSAENLRLQRFEN